MFVPGPLGGVETKHSALTAHPVTSTPRSRHVLARIVVAPGSVIDARKLPVMRLPDEPILRGLSICVAPDGPGWIVILLLPPSSMRRSLDASVQNRPI